LGAQDEDVGAQDEDVGALHRQEYPLVSNHEQARGFPLK
jgi:hypothetical protein